MNINYESIAIACFVAYTLAFYFKMNSSLLERHGIAVFLFVHFPIFCGLMAASMSIPDSNNTVTESAYALTFLFRFFRNDYV